MQPTRPGPEHDSKIDAKSVKEIVEPATAVPKEVSVEAALKEMRAQGDESSAVTEQGGKLFGKVWKDEMNRNVGGFGHDPATTPVEPQVDKDAARCFEGQTIGEVEKVMLEAKVDEVPVVTDDKVLVGKATLGAIAQKKHPAKAEAED
jgi:CBS domain-containing protein